MKTHTLFVMAFCAGLCGVAAPASRNAAQSFAVNLGGSAKETVDNDTAKVVGRGVGTTETEALKDAYRDAVERAVGLFVDAETAVRNDEVIKDQILTQSNAYIEHYDKVATESLSGGLVQVRILAVVKKRALTNRISSVMPAQTISLGGGIQDTHAQLVSRDKRNIDGAALLKNALQGINPVKQLLKPGVCPETQQLVNGKKGRGQLNWFRCESGIPEGHVGLSYVFKFELDRTKYFSEFVPRLKQVLDQISLQPPKTIRLSGVAEVEHDPRLAYMARYLKGGEMRNTRTDVERVSKGFYRPWRCLMGTVDGKTTSWLSSPRYCCSSTPHFSGEIEIEHCLYSGAIEKGRRDEIEKAYFTLITDLNEQGTMGKAVNYVLDKESVCVMNEWFESCGCGDDSKQDVTYNIIFLDEQGREISVTPWTIRCSILMNVGAGVYYQEGQLNVPIGQFYATPFVGGAGDSFIEWRDFVLSKDDLARIRQIRIELAE